jgi:glycosyltransferase involved in cell wall biosynthesis
VQVLIPVFRACPDVDLLIAGTGDFEPALRTMAVGAPNIRFLGRIDHRRLQLLYRGALATVVPSLCYETFGLVVAESFSAGTPVIVHAQSSLAEIVSAYGGGLMYRTTEELCTAIEQVRASPELRACLGRQGRAAYDAEFAEDAFLTHYLAVVHELLAKKRAGEPVTVPVETRGPQLLGGRPAFVAQNP